MQTTLRILKYLRLSLDDEGEGESNSITMQRELIDDYISEKFNRDDITVDEIVDDGYSGTNFKRPGITKALNLFNTGKYNCLIVKDFSRFGRDHIQVGNYLEHIFPTLGVRVISVNDNYDSDDHLGSSTGIDVVLKNLVYEMYSKDMSVKIRTAKRTIMKTGKYNASTAMYGYQKCDGKLIIDKNTAPVVIRIFERANERVRVSQIAKELNEDGIPSPSEYKRINNIANFRQFTDIKSLWEGHAVNKILHDERYTGKQIFGKYCSEKMRGKPIGLPEDELIVFENAHEAIISKELFDEVSGKLYTHKHVAYTVAKKPSIYKCGGCGRTLMKNRKGFYVCRYRNMNFSDSCIVDFILADELNETLYEIIKKQFSIMLGNAKKYKIIEKDSEYESEEELKNKIMSVKRERFDEYEKLKRGDISQIEFDKKRKVLQEKLDCIEAKLDEIKNNPAINPDQKHKADILINYGQIDDVDENFVMYFIKEVKVFREKHLKIIWNFGLNDFLTN